MSKVAFLFPGQGSQYLGMGKEIINTFNESSEIFEKGNKVLDFNLEDICFNNEEKLNRTDYTQPAILVISIAILKSVEKLGLTADYVAGLSLGEYTALVANGALLFEDAVKLVRKRGMFMEAAAKETEGKMAAVLKANKEEVKIICELIDGIVDIANYNSPKQIVIAGETKAFNKVTQILQEKGIKVIPLNVSGAFHSLLMKDAAKNLKNELANIQIHDFKIPYVTNVTGKIVKEKSNIKNLLVKQVYLPVMWEDSIQTLIKEGVETFIEIGPGKTLSGLVKKIDRKKKVFNIEDLNSLNKLETFIKGEPV